MTRQFMTTLEHSELKDLVRKAVAAVFSRIQTGIPATPKKDSLNAFVDIKEARRITGLSLDCLYKKARRKQIPHYKVDKRTLFKKSELIDWIKSGKIDAQ